MLSYYLLKYPWKCAALEQQVKSSVDISTINGDIILPQLVNYISCG